MDNKEDKLTGDNAGQYASADERPGAPKTAASRGSGQGPQLAAGTLSARVELGRQWLDARQVHSLGSGSVVELSADADDEVDITVSGTLAAHGELVVVGGLYGVRITRRAGGSKEQMNA